MRTVKPALLIGVAVMSLSGCSEHAAEQHAHEGTAQQQQQQQQQQQKQQRLQQHAHSHESHDTADALQLNNGSKWATDEPLRHAMQSIAEQLHPYQQQSGAGADYAALSKGIHSNVEYMIQNCKLEPQADAALHTIIAEMIAAADLLEGKQGDTARSQGVAKLAAALTSYSEHFDHPGFALH